MQSHSKAPIRKTLIVILLSILLVLAALPASSALAQRQATPAGAALPAGLLTPGGALHLTTNFQGALDLRGWEVTLDAQRGPLFRPVESRFSVTAASGGDWSALGTGIDGYAVNAIAVSGTSVYAGGFFTRAGTCLNTDGCNYIAKWDGSTWSPLGTGMPFGDVTAITVSASGDVYVGGFFLSAGTCTVGCNHIAKWDGSTWSPLGTGTNNGVYAIAILGSDIYAAGSFTSAGTCTSGCNNIAKWNGATWTALGTGMGGPYPAVLDIAVSGSDLYAGGQFASAGDCSSNCNHIAKWNGSAWSPLGTGTSGMVNALAVSGSAVYAGGAFSQAGTCTWANGCNNIAKWEGGIWSPLGMGTNEYVNAIAVSGSTVYAAGPFSVAGDCTSGCTNIAKWDGSTWSPLGTGITTNYQAVYTVAVSGTTVYAGGGGFTSAGTCTSEAGCKFIAKYTPSSNADLSNLALSSGTLTPPFASATTAYTASVANNVTGLFVTPTAADAGAAINIRINGGIWSAVTSGSPSWVSPLNLGANAVNVQVTAEDGTTTKTYTVSVTRLADTIPNRIYLPLVIH